LYNWYAVNTGKLAPTGWHVPTDSEWTVLTTYLGGEPVAGSKLKESGTQHWTGPNADATNTSGFSAIPGGQRYPSGTFSTAGTIGNWWSSTSYDFISALSRTMGYDNGNAAKTYTYKPSGFSVRCLKN
jgi:uncharacterized protein (TIGR02145 family)